MNKPIYQIDKEDKFDYKKYLEAINNDLEKIKDEYSDPLE